VKRWIASNKFPNAFKESNVLGWRIPLTDLINIIQYRPSLKEKVNSLMSKDVMNGGLSTQKNTVMIKDKVSRSNTIVFQQEQIFDRIKYIYNAVSLQRPSNELVEILAEKGMEAFLESLLYCVRYKPFRKYLLFIVIF
jgi:hypothetical protein